MKKNVSITKAVQFVVNAKDERYTMLGIGPMSENFSAETTADHGREIKKEMIIFRKTWQWNLQKNLTKKTS